MKDIKRPGQTELEVMTTVLHSVISANRLESNLSPIICIALFELSHTLRTQDATGSVQKNHLQQRRQAYWTHFSIQEAEQSPEHIIVLNT